MMPRRQNTPEKASRTHAPARAEGTTRPSRISVVIPLYNEEQSIAMLLGNIRKILEKSRWSWEVIFVDDGSIDGSFDVLRELNRRHPFVRAIKFKKNYGKSAALAAGFSEAKGDILITMDADLQDDPEEIPRLVEKIEEGYDVVSGWKQKRRDPLTKTIPSRLFNLVTAIVTRIRIHDFNCGLKAYRKRVVREIDLYGELHRYLPVLAYWKGFRIGEIKVSHHPRPFGKSKFGPSRFLSGFLDLLTVVLLTRYTLKPLHLFGSLGVLFTLAGIGINSYITYLRLHYGHIMNRHPLLMLGVLLMIVGIQFFSTGLIAEMITSLRTDKSRYMIEDRLHGRFAKKGTVKTFLSDVTREVKKETRAILDREKNALKAGLKKEKKKRTIRKKKKETGEDRKPAQSIESENREEKDTRWKKTEKEPAADAVERTGTGKQDKSEEIQVTEGVKETGSKETGENEQEAKGSEIKKGETGEEKNQITWGRRKRKEKRR
jgi:glycosyltransferase involved in cell wall biosynthesis